MKKFIELLLAAVMCFSLAACSGNGTQQGTSENGGEEINIIGTWVNNSENDTWCMSFEEDGTGTMIRNNRGQEITWKRKGETVTFKDSKNRKAKFTIEDTDGMITLNYKDDNHEYVMVSQEELLAIIGIDLNLLSGDWKFMEDPMYSSGKALSDTFTLNADGTCVYDDVTYSSKVTAFYFNGEDTAQQCNFWLYNGKDATYEIRLVYQGKDEENRARYYIFMTNFTEDGYQDYENEVVFEKLITQE